MFPVLDPLELCSKAAWALLAQGNSLAQWGWCLSKSWDYRSTGSTVSFAFLRVYLHWRVLNSPSLLLLQVFNEKASEDQSVQKRTVLLTFQLLSIKLHVVWPFWNTKVWGNLFSNKLFPREFCLFSARRQPNVNLALIGYSSKAAY